MVVVPLGIGSDIYTPINSLRFWQTTSRYTIGYSLAVVCLSLCTPHQSPRRRRRGIFRPVVFQGEGRLVAVLNLGYHFIDVREI